MVVVVGCIYNVHGVCLCRDTTIGKRCHANETPQSLGNRCLAGGPVRDVLFHEIKLINNKFAAVYHNNLFSDEKNRIISIN